MAIVTKAARLVAGSVYRRVRREMQWRDPRLRFASARLDPSSAERDFPHILASHATPLIRPLSGLDERLQRNKIGNLRLAASALDGLVLAPGERMSFWREVGRPAYRRGFVDGMVLDHGRITSGAGGGLCQSTNLLYWMTLHSPLSVIERWRHSYDVFPDASRTQPFGSGATCAWPSLDLQVLNATAVPVLLRLRVTATTLEGEWRSPVVSTERFEVYEAAHRIVQEGPGRYVRCNVLRRRRLDAEGRELAEELVAANRAFMMYAPLLEAPAEA